MIKISQWTVVAKISLAIDTYLDFNCGFSTVLYNDISSIKEQIIKPVIHLPNSRETLFQDLLHLKSSLVNFWKDRLSDYIEMTEHLFTPFFLVVGEIWSTLDVIQDSLNGTQSHSAWDFHGYIGEQKKRVGSIILFLAFPVLKILTLHT